MWSLGSGAIAVLGTSLGRAGIWWVAGIWLGGAALSAVRNGPKRLLALVAIISFATGSLSSGREQNVLDAPVPEGLITVRGVTVGDGRSSFGGGGWVLIRPTHLSVGAQPREWRGPTLLASGPLAELGAHTIVELSGVAKKRPGRVRGEPYAGVVAVRTWSVLEQPSGIFGIADLMRDRVSRQLSAWPGDSAAGLVSGFLIGDTTEVAAVDEEILRRAGLSHFVAVSGSNVAMFLMLWWIVVLPLAFGPRRRAVGGLIGLGLFVVLTRWEPSVVRAAVMASVVLIARAISYPLSAWSALGIATTAIMLVSPELVANVGFQLSIAATLGVMVSHDLFRTQIAPVGTAFSATIGAQVAVAPLLLSHFGTVPLMAPLANIVAMGAVTLSTLMGAVGVLIGWEPALWASVVCARFVLWVAELAAVWPQLGPAAALAVAGLAIAVAWTPTRKIGLGVMVVTLTINLVANPPVERPAIVALDIGQGDAILLLGPRSTILIDGGPDPILLMEKLHDFDIEVVDLLIISHPHEDHQGGLGVVVERWPVGAIWHSGWTDAGGTFSEITDTAEERQIPLVVPNQGWYRIGGWTLEVLGPQRRYAGANDQSLVIRASFGETSVFLTGDIEKFAQSDIGMVSADILKVPHHGGATTDLSWLAESDAKRAIVSVGDNSFGHPDASVLARLEASGIAVSQTVIEGDIVIELGR